MKKLILLLITLIMLTNLSYAAFPVTDDLSYVALAPWDDGWKSLLWGIIGFPFCWLIFPPILAIKYGISGWNGRESTASRIGLFLGVIGLIMLVILAFAVLAAMALGAAYGG